MEITLMRPSDGSMKKIQIEWERLSKETAAALVADLYDADSITIEQARDLLNLASLQETLELLRQHGCRCNVKE
jgi:hypothetical protein